MMFWIALLFLFCTQKGEERNEEIREIFGNDWGIDGDYVLYDVFQCLRPRSYLFSQTRLFMALMMGAMMAIIMLLFMWKMYDNKKMNIGILVVSVVLFLVHCLWSEAKPPWEIRPG